MQRFDFEMLDPARVKQAIPQIGPEVVGASYSRYDGHCNSPRLFRALNAAMQQLGVAYLPEHRVDRIEYVAREFRLFSARGEIRASKIVLAAGIDNVRLGPMVGLDVPVRPQRGQLIVTERPASRKSQHRAHVGRAAGHDERRFPDLRSIRKVPRGILRVLPQRRHARRGSCPLPRAVHCGWRLACRAIQAFQLPEIRCSSACSLRRRTRR